MLRSVAILPPRILLLVAVFVSLALSTIAQPATKDVPKAKSAAKPNLNATQKADVAAPKVGAKGPDSVNEVFQSMHEKFNARIKKGNVDLLFIGDSITQGWSGNGKDVWTKNYEKRNAVNLGIGGDQTQHVLWRLQNGNLDGPIKPKAAVIMIGTNNTGHHKPEDIANGITEIVKTVRRKLPETKVLLLAVFPRKRPNDVKDIDERLSKINNSIKKLDDGKMVTYLDIGPKFIDKDGTLHKEIMPDFLHLSPEGYKIWADAIEEKLTNLMGETVKKRRATKAAPAKDMNSVELQKAHVAVPKNSKTEEKVDRGFLTLHESYNERVKKGNIDLLFIGDSITFGWTKAGKDVWTKNYEKRNAVNLGIGGDQTQHVLWRLQNGNLDGPIKPKVAVIMIGTNNASRGFASEQIAAGITAIVKELRTKLPETKILLLAVFPRGQDPETEAVKKIREKITKTNEIIKKLDDGKMVTFLDIGPKFLEKDGTLDKKIMPDFLHLSPAGYEIWAEAIEEKLANLMEER